MKHSKKGRPRKPEMQPWAVWIDRQTIETIRDLAREKNVRQSDVISQAIRNAFGNGK